MGFANSLKVIYVLFVHLFIIFISEKMFVKKYFYNRKGWCIVDGAYVWLIFELLTVVYKPRKGLV